MIEGFVHPALAAGTLLAGVPIIIHLLNRQRHRPLAWAGMRFVMAAYKRTRRRAQLENLLLLLLRVLAVALLALALARPFTGARSPLAALTENRRDVVIVIDGSASTGYREHTSSSYERILDRARDLLLELDTSRGDRARLFLAGSYPRLLAWRTPDEALSVLATLHAPTDESLNLAAAFTDVLKLIETESLIGTGELEIRLLTDLQARSFQPPQAPAGEGSPTPGTALETPLDAVLDQLDDLELTVVVEDLGPAAPVPANVSVVDVRPLGTLLGAGVPSELGVTVRNFGSRLVGNVRVRLFVNGEAKALRQVEIPARESTQIVFPTVFATPGYHFVEAKVDTDGLAIDDQRPQVVYVPPAQSVLLVNGDPHDSDILLDEVGLMEAVLAPHDDDLSGLAQFAPFLPRVTYPDALGSGQVDLSETDVIILANVSSLPDSAVRRIEERVAAGATLIVSLGDQVSVEAYNRRMWRADGSGLLPAELGSKVEVRDRRSTYHRVGAFAEEHPALEFFADERWRPLFSEVPIYAFLATDPIEMANVLARIDDEDASPLLLERDYDRGKVFLWTSTFDAAWTRLPESPRTLVPFLHELLRYAATPRHDSRNVSLGGPLLAEVRGFPRAAAVLRPDGSRLDLPGEPIEVSEGHWRLPPVSSTDHVGRWEIETEGSTGAAFAVQFDPREGNLERLAPAELERLHPTWVPLTTGADSGPQESNESTMRGELWRWLAALCLAALVLESLWASWIGWKRRLAS